MPPSVDELEIRLNTRGTEDPNKIKTRIEKARDEMKFSNQFDDIIINNQLDKAIEEVTAVVISFLKS